MSGKEFWKVRYKDKWKDGLRRENLIKELLEMWDYKVFDFGFETLSTEYNPNSPDEKGKPDFYVEKNNQKIFIEVTGTDSPRVLPSYSIWIRPDKIEYIKKHNLKAFCAHVLENYQLIRFIDMNEINDNKIITRTIRGTPERYFEISPNECLSVDEFNKILEEI